MWLPTRRTPGAGGKVRFLMILLIEEILHHLGWCQNLVNNGLKATYQLVQDVFHQQHHEIRSRVIYPGLPTMVSSKWHVLSRDFLRVCPTKPMSCGTSIMALVWWTHLLMVMGIPLLLGDYLFGNGNNGINNNGTPLGSNSALNGIPLMVSFPHYSHILRDSYGSGMGIVGVRGPTMIGHLWSPSPDAPWDWNIYLYTFLHLP